MEKKNASPEELFSFSKKIIIGSLFLMVITLFISKVNNAELSNWFWFFLVMFIIGILGYSTFKSKIQQIEIDNINFNKLKNKEYNKNNFIWIKKYFGGIHGVNKNNIPILLYPSKTGFEIFDNQYNRLGDLLNEQITDISIEDKSSVEKRLSVTNIALFGVLGLAMRKSKEYDVSLLIIKLSDGRFTHEGIFSFEYTKEEKMKDKNLNSYNEASNVRTKMINHLNSLK